MTNAKRKGGRRERQAREIYEAAGFEVQPFYGRKYGETDGFSLFDFVAVAPDRDPHFVQVKSNSASGIGQWADDCAELFGRAHAHCVYLVCHDREGWRFLTAHADGSHHEAFDGREDGRAMGEAMSEFIAAEGG